MNILDDTERVVGLFDNERDVEKTMAKFHELGLSQDEGGFEIVDKNRLTSKMPLQQSEPDTQSSQRTVGTGTAVGPMGVTRSEFVETPTVESKAKERLTHLGIDDEEATFFARHIARQSAVVVVEADSSEQADEIARLMQAANARVSRS
jgi:hypothetical protein